MKIFATSTYSNDIGCVEEDPLKKHSIKRLKGIAPKPNVVINLGEMNVAIELEGQITIESDPNSATCDALNC